jgi:hypothetical protein
VINMAHMSDEAAAELIIAALRLKTSPPAAGQASGG